MAMVLSEEEQKLIQKYRSFSPEQKTAYWQALTLMVQAKDCGNETERARLEAEADHIIGRHKKPHAVD